MATKFILAGGNDRASETYWLDLKSALGTLQNSQVLSCFFAQSEDVWEEKFSGFKKFFDIAFGADAKYELASFVNFSDQVKAADIIYLHGGDTNPLFEGMLLLEHPEEDFRNKIVIGSSAGAHYLSDNFWSCGRRGYGKGAGLTPLNVLVHYGSNYGSDEPAGPIDWVAAETDLRGHLDAGAQVTRIPEGEFVVYES